MHDRIAWRQIAVARACHNNELREGEHVAIAVPLVNFRESVGADDEIEIGDLRPKFFDGEDGVTLLGPLFQARRNKARVGQAGKFNHAVAVLEALAAEVVLVRRMRRGNEEDLIEGEGAGGFPSNGDVREMDRVESAAEDGK